MKKATFIIVLFSYCGLLRTIIRHDFCPMYPDGALSYPKDRRQTLYWNPNVKTNKKGEAVVRCCNSGKSAFATVDMKALHDGYPAANYHSIE